MNNEIITEALLDELVSDEEIAAAANKTDANGDEAQGAPETESAAASAEQTPDTQETGTPENEAGAESDPVFNGWLDFFMNHRDISSDGIPDKVYRMAAGGTGPEAAYAIYKTQQQVSELREALKKAEARAAAPGSRVPTAGSEPAADPFTEGWNNL